MKEEQEYFVDQVGLEEEEGKEQDVQDRQEDEEEDDKG